MEFLIIFSVILLVFAIILGIFGFIIINNRLSKNSEEIIYNSLISNDEFNKIKESLIQNKGEIFERLTKIDEAQKSIDKVSINLLDFQKILTDKKTRGIFGEIELNKILYNVFGEPGSLYELQYEMKNLGKKVDACVFAPDPISLIPIDSKFPLENYNKVIEGDISYINNFYKDLKKHIDDINEKYVVSQGVNQAVIFIPAEGVYSYIITKMPEILQYSYEKKIWIASPTTLMAVLTSIQLVIVNIKRTEIADKLQAELIKLGVEFNRYKERWEKLDKDMLKVYNDVNLISVTSNKIQSLFKNIEKSQIIGEDDV